MDRFESIRTMSAKDRPINIYEYMDHALLGNNKELVWTHNMIDETISIQNVKTQEIVCEVKILPGDTWGDVEEKVKQRV